MAKIVHRPMGLNLTQAEYESDHAHLINGVATDIHLGALGASAWVVANDATASIKDFATMLYLGGYPVWVCGGIADDVEIQAAIDAAFTARGSVVVSGGQFNFSSPIFVKVPLLGSGIGQTVFRLASAAQKNIIEIDDYGEVHNLTVDGNYLENLQGEEGWATISDVPVTHGITTANFNFGGDAVSGTTSDYCKISNVEIKDCVRSCLCIMGNSHRVDNIFLSNSYTDHLIYATRGDDIIIRNIHGSGMAHAEVISLGHSLRDSLLDKIVIEDLATSAWGGYPIYAITFRADDMGVTQRNNIIRNVTVFDSSDNIITAVQVNHSDATVENLYVELSGAKPECTIVCPTACTNFRLRGFTAKIDATDFSSVLYAISVRRSQKIVLSDIIIDETSATTKVRGVDLQSSAAGATSDVFIDNLISNAKGLFLRYYQATEPIERIYLGKMINISGASTQTAGSPTFMKNSGTATILNTTTSIVVAHGLAATPTRIQITPRENPTNAVTFWWVDTLTATTFKININADPGASNLTFYWKAEV